jgi:hypothetical protein
MNILESCVLWRNIKVKRSKIYIAALGWGKLLIKWGAVMKL